MSEIDLSGLSDFTPYEEQDEEATTEKNTELSPDEKRLQALTDQREKINKQISQVRARKRQQKRKDETRKKIILGGFLLSQIEKNTEAKKLYDACLKSLRADRDIALFKS